MTTPRVALVSGANRGIGLATARLLAERGLHVVVGSRDPEAGARVAEELVARGLRASAHELDVADAASVKRLRRDVLAEHGRLDVLVNNAGVALDEGASLEADDETVRATLEVNLLGAWRLCRAFAPVMREHGYGRIVNVSSGAGSVTDPSTYAPTYSVSKAALNMFTRILAQELGGTNVKVNAACPDWCRTRMGGAGAPRSPEEGADTIVWLATLPDDGPTDGFFRDRRPADW